MERRTIGKETEAKVLLSCRRRCCFCWWFKSDDSEKNGQIAHIDHDPSNPSEDNLVYLCLDHHDEYDTARRQTKKMTPAEAREALESLLIHLEGSCVESVSLTWTIGRDFNGFSDAHEKEIVDFLKRHVRAGSTIRVTARKPGRSVLLTTSLAPEDAVAVLAAWDAHRLGRSDVLDVTVADISERPDVYVFQGPLSPLFHSRVCLPRADVVGHILRLFASRRWVGFFGRPGFGRTTLLRLIVHHPALSRNRVLPLAVDAARMADTSKPSVFDSFVSECRVAFERLPNDLIAKNDELGVFFARRDFKAEGPDALQRFLITAAEKAYGHELLLMLDDADLLPRQCRGLIFRTLRTLHTIQPTGAWTIHLVVTGESDGLWLGRHYGIDADECTSPLSECLQRLFLEPFRAEEVAELASIGESDCGIAVKPEAVSDVMSLTHGIPAGVQRLLSFVFRHAVRKKLKEISSRDVRDVAWSREYQEARPGSASETRGLVGRVSDIASAVTRIGERLSNLESEIKGVRAMLEGRLLVQDALHPNPIDQQIGRLYDELAELRGLRAQFREDENVRTQIQTRFHVLRELQEQEARAIESRYLSFFSMPIDGGERLLREGQEMRKRADTN